MKKLTLIRHAKSDWNDPSLSDFDRPLNARGKKAAPLMGQRMAKRKAVPDLLISSPAKRARKTAQLIAKEIGFPKEEIGFEKKLFDASERTLVKILRKLPEAGHVALVAHNPGLTEIAGWLCPDAPEWLPTCAVLSLELDVNAWEEITPHCARLIDYDYPKKTG